MIGITRYAAYVPRFRLERRLIASAWGARAGRGEIAVANYDEDSLTLAVEAALGCLGGDQTVQSAYFASTSSPYGEKQVSSLLATACDLPREIETADFAGSARAGLTALLAALRSVRAGPIQRGLVAAADVRAADPESELEGVLGDGAASMLVGDRNVIAEFVDSASVAEEFTYVWRTDTARTVQVAGGKFSSTHGYGRDLGQAVRAVLERQGLEPKDVGTLALYSPDARAASDLAGRLGFDPERQLATPLAARMGCTGCAEPLLLLADVLDRAEPDQLVLVGAYGEGADVLLFRVTGEIDHGRSPVPVQRWLDAGEALPSYERYLKYRRLIPVEEMTDVVTNVLELKELKQNLRLYGSRCRECGTVQYPMAQVCIRCHARGGLDDAKIAHHGRVFTYTVDHLAATLESPLPMAVVDMEGGGRLYLQVTDTHSIEVDTPVVVTFRRLHEGGGNHNYYWKARPVRERPPEAGA